MIHLQQRGYGLQNEEATTASHRTHDFVDVKNQMIQDSYRNLLSSDSSQWNSTFSFDVISFFPNMHLSGIRRFGHTTDFSSIFGSKDEVNDYKLGLIKLGVFCTTFYTAWFVTIIIFYLLGHKRVGFLSGKPFQRRRITPFACASENLETIENRQIDVDSSSINSDLNSSEVIVENRTPTTMTESIGGGGGGHGDCATCYRMDKIVLIRLVFVISGFVMVLFGVLLATLGLNNLKRSMEYINNGSSDVIDILTTANYLLTTTATTVSDKLSIVIPSLTNELQAENICPGSSTVNSTLPIVVTLQEFAVKGLEVLEAIDKFDIPAYVDQVSNAILRQIHVIQRNYYDPSSHLYDVLYQLSTLILTTCTIIPPLVTVPVIFILKYGTTNRALQRSLVYIFFPLFFLLVATASLVSVGSFVGTTMNSDFCVPDMYFTETTALASEFLNDGVNNKSDVIARVHFNPPDISSLDVLQRLGINVGSLEYAMSLYYITQCTVVNPYDKVMQHSSYIETAATMYDEFLLEANQTLEDLTIACQRDFNDMFTAIESAKTSMFTIALALEQVLYGLRCENLVPIYQRMIYFGTCDFSLKALIWVFAASFIISFFGLLMITFRAACFETVYISDNNDHDHLQNESQLTNTKQELQSNRYEDIVKSDDNIQTAS